jgi:hypothetical protein
MFPELLVLQYALIRWLAALDRDRSRGEVSATTIVMAAALIALAITVGGIITTRVTNKANTLQLG